MWSVFWCARNIFLMCVIIIIIIINVYYTCIYIIIYVSVTRWRAWCALNSECLALLKKCTHKNLCIISGDTWFCESSQASWQSVSLWKYRSSKRSWSPCQSMKHGVNSACPLSVNWKTEIVLGSGFSSVQRLEVHLSIYKSNCWRMLHTSNVTGWCAMK